MTASAAQGADRLPFKAPPPAELSWSGLYLGAHGGYGWGRDPQSFNAFGAVAPPFGDIASRGGVWGFQAGANWQSGAWVGGLEIDLSGVDIKGSTSTSGSLIVGPSVSTGAGTET